MNKTLPTVVTAAAAGVAAWLCLAPAGRRAEDVPSAANRQAATSGSASIAGSAREDRRAKAGAQAGRPRREKPRAARFSPDVEDSGADGEEGWSPAEKKLAERIDKALDDEDFAAAAACAAEAQSCRAPGVRKAMVEALGWFGARAVPEITPFLADADDDVREDAVNEWSMAVSDIDDDAEKLAMVERAMSVLTDEDALEDMSGEYIGVDEKLAVESLLRVIESGGSAEGIAKAKETYEFVTGEEFAGRDAAERWVAEEYEPPDEPAEAPAAD